MPVLIACQRMQSDRSRLPFLQGPQPPSFITHGGRSRLQPQRLILPDWDRKLHQHRAQKLMFSAIKRLIRVMSRQKRTEDT